MYAEDCSVVVVAVATITVAPVAVIQQPTVTTAVMTIVTVREIQMVVAMADMPSPELA